jgi:amino acid transporter
LNWFLFSFLEGCANGICTAGSTAGTNGNLLGGTVGVAIMMNAIFYVTANTLDVILVAEFFSGTVFFILIHFIDPPLNRL